MGKFRGKKKEEAPAAKPVAMRGEFSDESEDAEDVFSEEEDGFLEENDLLDHLPASEDSEEEEEKTEQLRWGKKSQFFQKDDAVKHSEDEVGLLYMCYWDIICYHLTGCVNLICHGMCV
jgi:hypothetical protein